MKYIIALPVTGYYCAPWTVTAAVVCMYSPTRNRCSHAKKMPFEYEIATFSYSLLGASSLADAHHRRGKHKMWDGPPECNNTSWPSVGGLCKLCARRCRRHATIVVTSTRIHEERRRQRWVLHNEAQPLKNTFAAHAHGSATVLVSVESIKSVKQVI